jgi:hypothetical protein
VNPVDDPKPEQAGQAEESVDHSRREAMVRLAKYTAPAMLALLLSTDNSMAALPCTSSCT